MENSKIGFKLSQKSEDRKLEKANRKRKKITFRIKKQEARRQRPGVRCQKSKNCEPEVRRQWKKQTEDG